MSKAVDCSVCAHPARDEIERQIRAFGNDPDGRKQILSHYNPITAYHKPKHHGERGWFEHRAPEIFYHKFVCMDGEEWPYPPASTDTSRERALKHNEKQFSKWLAKVQKWTRRINYSDKVPEWCYRYEEKLTYVPLKDRRLISHLYAKIPHHEERRLSIICTCDEIFEHKPAQLPAGLKLSDCFKEAKEPVYPKSAWPLKGYYSHHKIEHPRKETGPYHTKAPKIEPEAEGDDDVELIQGDGSDPFIEDHAYNAEERKPVAVLAEYSPRPPTGGDKLTHRLTEDDRKAIEHRIIAVCGKEPESNYKAKIRHFERCLEEWTRMYESRWKIIKTAEQRAKLKEIDNLVDSAFKTLPGPAPNFLEAWSHLPDKEYVFAKTLTPAIRQKLPHLKVKQVQDSLRRLYKAKLLRLAARGQQLGHLLERSI